MKTSKYHILFSWILLLCFAAGQYMVYAHQHPSASKEKTLKSISKTIPHQVVKEKCSLCDVMLHNAMLASYQVYVAPVNVAGHVFENVDYEFTSARLILAGGRAPPGHNL